METKICNKCPERGEQSIEKFREVKVRGKYRRRAICYECDKEDVRNRNIKRYREDPEYRDRVIQYAEKRRRAKGVPIKEASSSEKRRMSSKKWRDNNKDFVKKIQQQYYLKDKQSGRSAERARQYRKRRKEDTIRYTKSKEYFREIQQKRVEGIHDIYIKCILSRSGIPVAYVTSELIELQRESIQVYRQLKQIK